MPGRNQLERNPRWKGDDASYSAFHKRARRYLGKPDSCIECGSSGGDKLYEWTCKGDPAVLENYYEICNSCNRKKHK